MGIEYGSSFGARLDGRFIVRNPPVEQHERTVSWKPEETMECSLLTIYDNITLTFNSANMI